MVGGVIEGVVKGVVNEEVDEQLVGWVQNLEIGHFADVSLSP